MHTVENIDKNLFTCKTPQSDKVTKYAKLQPIGVHLSRWEQINDVENNVQIVQGGTGEYFSGLAQQHWQTRPGIV